ncbi:MAG TPA: pitrilysin family protein [Longimicrobiales bacterium]|nr:pitrilysin family protein [Longimicrobiales bacterium]
MTDDRFERSELPGGLVVVTERIPWVRSVSAGIWLRQGSAHEQGAELGASHLLEHMVFKGTERRAPKEIALALERRGGELDAYTTREHTSYQARVLDEDLGLAMDVLADIVVSPLLQEQDLALEREVVLEEIAGVEDTPDDLVFELHGEALWGPHPYGHSILGTRETVTALDAVALRDVHARAYRRPNMVVGAVGNLEHEAFVGMVGELLSSVPNGTANAPIERPVAPAGSAVVVERDTAQTHIVFGAATFGHSDPRRYAIVMLSSAFGGGMSSRLFQRVREELGLAYAVYAFQSFYGAAGLCGVYVGTRPEWAERVTEVVTEEMAAIARDGLTSVELDDVRGQMKGQLVLSLESTSARLGRVVGTALYEEAFQTAEELLAKVDAVTAADIAELAAEYLDPARQTVVRLGPVN